MLPFVFRAAILGSWWQFPSGHLSFKILFAPKCELHTRKTNDAKVQNIWSIPNRHFSFTNIAIGSEEVQTPALPKNAEPVLNLAPESFKTARRLWSLIVTLVVGSAHVERNSPGWLFFFFFFVGVMKYYLEKQRKLNNRSNGRGSKCKQRFQGLGRKRKLSLPVCETPWCFVWNAQARRKKKYICFLQIYGINNQLGFFHTLASARAEFYWL